MKFWTKEEHRSIILYMLSIPFTHIWVLMFLLGYTIFLKCFAYACVNY
jgi:hypothetical protein